MLENIQLTEAQKTQVSELAALFFTPEEIKIILGFSEELNEFERTYMAARLQSEAALRHKVVAMAKAGSGPAITDAFKLIMSLRMEEAT